MFGMTELQDFLARGGPILTYAILPATFFMWALILERVFYFRVAHKSVAKDAIAEWDARKSRVGDWNAPASDKKRYAHWVKDKLVSEVRMKAEQNVGLTKAAVALAPLLGLLGTVTGMVQVFDILAITNGADAKAMSAGVSQATIPTMAGMVASLSGILFTSGMDRRVRRSVQKVEDAMEMS